MEWYYFCTSILNYIYFVYMLLFPMQVVLKIYWSALSIDMLNICSYMLSYAFICSLHASFPIYPGSKAGEWMARPAATGDIQLECRMGRVFPRDCPRKTRVTESEKTPTGRFEGSAVSGLASCECTGITDSFWSAVSYSYLCLRCGYAVKWIASAAKDIRQQSF